MKSLFTIALFLACVCAITGCTSSEEVRVAPTMVPPPVSTYTEGKLPPEAFRATESFDVPVGSIEMGKSSFEADAKAIAKNSKSPKRVSEELAGCASEYQESLDDVAKAIKKLDKDLRAKGIKQDMVPVLQDLQTAFNGVPQVNRAFIVTAQKYGQARIANKSHRDAIQIAVKGTWSPEIPEDSITVVPSTGEPKDIEEAYSQMTSHYRPRLGHEITMLIASEGVSPDINPNDNAVRLKPVFRYLSKKKQDGIKKKLIGEWIKLVKEHNISDKPAIITIYDNESDYVLAKYP